MWVFNLAKKRRRKRKRTRKTKKNNVSGYGLIVLIVIGMFLVVGIMKFVKSPTFIYYNQPNISQQDKKFVNKVLPEAVVVQKKYRILTSITLAQAILESNWGQSELAAKYHNTVKAQSTELI